MFISKLFLSKLFFVVHFVLKILYLKSFNYSNDTVEVEVVYFEVISFEVILHRFFILCLKWKVSIISITSVLCSTKNLRFLAYHFTNLFRLQIGFNYDKVLVFYLHETWFFLSLSYLRVPFILCLIGLLPEKNGFIFVTTKCACITCFVMLWVSYLQFNNFDRYTVKPVYNHHPWDPKLEAVVDRWSLFRGSFVL